MKMVRVAPLLALQAIADAFVPQPFPKDEASDSLKAIGWSSSDARDPLDRLLLNGVLTERPGGARFDREFALDPVAEYLAADELLQQCGRDSQRIEGLFERVRTRAEAASGFLRALEVTREVQSVAIREPLIYRSDLCTLDKSFLVV